MTLEDAKELADLIGKRNTLIDHQKRSDARFYSECSEALYVISSAIRIIVKKYHKTEFPRGQTPYLVSYDDSPFQHP